MYQAYARTLRPQQFDQVIGQDEIVRVFQNALKQNRVHHAYLLTGTRGVGKTTLARIFAKALNCVEGVTANPCDQCEHCEAIKQGNFPDLIEVDGASKTKVDDTRALLDNIPYLPQSGRVKVYLIDEVHMLSNHSFNALLKTLEEPPPHVKFILATTDPQKLPPTLMSRCLKLHLRSLDETTIVDYLSNTLNAEKYAFEMPAMTQLAAAANGSMRDALSLLDQAVAAADGCITESVVAGMLGMVSDQIIADLLIAIHAFDIQKVEAAVAHIHATTTQFDALFARILRLLQQLAKAKLYQKTGQTFDLALFNPLLDQLSAADIQTYYQMMLDGRRDLRYAPSEMLGFEMTAIRMAAFRPLLANATSHEADPQKAQSSTTKDPLVTQKASPAPSGFEASSQRVNPQKSAQNQPNDFIQKPSPRAETSQAQFVESSPVTHIENTQSELTRESVPAESSGSWSDCVASLKLIGPSKQVLMNSVGEQIAQNRWKISVPKSTAAMLSDLRKSKILEAFQAKYGNNTTLEWSEVASVDTTPAEQRAAAVAKATADNIEQMKNDPNVQAIEQQTGARMNPNSIETIER